MKGFLLLVVFSLAGLAGVLYWRQTLQAPATPVAAVGERAKEGKGKERRRRQRRGAKRLARNDVRGVGGGDVFVASPNGEATVAEGAYAPAPRPQERERAPLAPGGASITEAAPSEVFGELSSPSASAGGGRQPADEPAPIKLSAADLKIVWQGEDLSRAETVRMDFSNEEGGHELSQDEIDSRFRSKEDAVLGCISRARPDEYTYVPGRVSVRFRIQRTGVVKGVQVEAPVILHRGGLLGCVRGVVGGLRFPASNAGQVVTYPFSLM
jgi:hypothetical protein